MSTEHQKNMEIGNAVDRLLNEGRKDRDYILGFVLLTFKFGHFDDGKSTYISNGASRKEIARMLREHAEQLEKEMR